MSATAGDLPPVVALRYQVRPGAPLWTHAAMALAAMALAA